MYIKSQKNENEKKYCLLKMDKRYKSVIDILLYTYADYMACHSENQIEPAILNGEQCEIGCPKSANVLSFKRLHPSFRERDSA